ncbi:hypothetical protein NL676_005824 [Syzygium grande]|nr:hypothetical protein NL676_005824 [Syzygium grande]
MEDSLDSGVEYEIVDDEEEHEELGGLAFEPEIVDPIPEQADAEAPEPMDSKRPDLPPPSSAKCYIRTLRLRRTLTVPIATPPIELLPRPSSLSLLLSPCNTARCATRCFDDLLHYLEPPNRNNIAVPFLFRP